MSENRDLPEPTGEERVSRLSQLVDWLDREGGSARGVRIVRVIAGHDLQALRAGLEPEPCDPIQICGFLAGEGDQQAKAALGMAGPDKRTDPGDLIRNARPAEALASRLPKLRPDWRRTNSRWEPKLTKVVGGGRSIPTLYRLDFEPLVDQPAEGPTTAAPSPLTVQYEVMSLKAAWPLRWLFVQGGFEVSFQAWRGIAYIAAVLIAMLAIVIFALLGLASLGSVGKRPSAILESAMAFACAYAFWRTAHPFLEVANKRIIASPQLLLPMSEIVGQLKFVRRKDLKVPRGWLSLVRIRSQCPFCESEIDLEDGGSDFPGRTVGRCREAPAEHVFSFDPTSNQGHWLRADQSTSLNWVNDLHTGSHLCD